MARRVLTNVAIMPPRVAIAALGVAFVAISAHNATARACSLGAADPSLFDRVINLPADVNDDSGSTPVLGELTQINVASGGSIGHWTSVVAGNEMNVCGGTVGAYFSVQSGSRLNLSGGSVGIRFNYQGTLDAEVKLFGGDFMLNGLPYSGPDLTLSRDERYTLTGTLADGSAFIFTDQASDRLLNVTLTPAPLPALDTAPIVIDATSPPRPAGLRAGQTLTLTDGGDLGNNFEVVNATLNVAGGRLGESAGATGDSFVNINGGTVGRNFSVYSGSVVNISGGTVDNYFDAFSGSVVNISGGTLDSDFDAHGGSEVNFIGTEFSIDGVLLDGLVLGEPFLINERNVRLTGTLADETQLSSYLNDFKTAFLGPSRYFARDAAVTVTLVSSGLPGDYNGDGTVNAADYNVWRDQQGNAVTLINETATPGRVSIEDYYAWAANFGAVFTPTGAAVPESGCLALLALGLFTLALRPRPRSDLN